MNVNKEAISQYKIVVSELITFSSLCSCLIVSFVKKNIIFNYKTNYRKASILFVGCTYFQFTMYISFTLRNMLNK